jgi:DNA-binding NarL/FixJ family response regulator
LIVDDDEGTRCLISAVLSRAGYDETRELASGEEALELIEAEPPLLLVLDVHLPGLSGYEVCREVREVLRSTVPVLFISGERTEPHDRVAGLLIGGDDYLVKPFAPDELIARVHALVRRATVRAAAGISLTPRELDVLRLLAEGHAQTEIAQRLFISPKTVGTHVEHILRKLGAHNRAQAVAQAYREGLLEAAGR